MCHAHWDDVPDSRSLNLRSRRIALQSCDGAWTSRTPGRLVKTQEQHLCHEPRVRSSFTSRTLVAITAFGARGRRGRARIHGKLASLELGAFDAMLFEQFAELPA